MTQIPMLIDDLSHFEPKSLYFYPGSIFIFGIIPVKCMSCKQLDIDKII